MARGRAAPAARARERPGWRDAPLVWLTAAGLGLVLLGFIVAAIFDGFDADCTYIPSRMVDGQLVPAELRCDDA